MICVVLFFFISAQYHSQTKKQPLLDICPKGIDIFILTFHCGIYHSMIISKHTLRHDQDLVEYKIYYHLLRTSNNEAIIRCTQCPVSETCILERFNSNGTQGSRVGYYVYFPTHS
jgi:hypothetical protein